MSLLMGADPEFFITNTKGGIVPAHRVGIPPPNKKVPTLYGAYFRDGWALECNPNPHPTPLGVYFNVVNILEEVKKILPKGYGFSTVPSTNINLASLRHAPKDVQTFGCHPSYNAYSMRVVKPEVDAKVHPLRSLSGHFHFSGLPILDDPNNYPLIIKNLDLYVGVPWTAILHRKEAFAPEGRRSLYGKAGEFRIQKYPNGQRGLEWRVMSADVFSSSRIYESIGRLIQNILYKLSIKLPEWDNSLDEPIQRGINTGDLPTLEGLIERTKTPKYMMAVDDVAVAA